MIHAWKGQMRALHGQAKAPCCVEGLLFPLHRLKSFLIAHARALSSPLYGNSQAMIG